MTVSIVGNTLISEIVECVWGVGGGKGVFELSKWTSRTKMMVMAWYGDDWGRVVRE